MSRFSAIKFDITASVSALRPCGKMQRIQSTRHERPVKVVSLCSAPVATAAIWFRPSQRSCFPLISSAGKSSIHMAICFSDRPPGAHVALCGKHPLQIECWIHCGPHDATKEGREVIDGWRHDAGSRLRNQAHEPATIKFSKARALLRDYFRHLPNH